MTNDLFEVEVSKVEKTFEPPKRKYKDVPTNDMGMVELGMHSDISNADYHASKGISSSAVKKGAKCMKLYKEYTDGNLPHSESKAMRIGTLVHKLFLEPEDFSNEFVLQPRKYDLRKKVDNQEKEEFDQFVTSYGLTVVDPDELRKAEYMCESLMGNSDLMSIRNHSSSTFEQSGYYIDPKTQMLCKYRPDLRTDFCILDVKTCKDASAVAFSRDLNSYGYHISAAHYLAGDTALKKTSHRQFIFACVESEPPYLSAIYVLDEDSLQLGEMIRDETLALIKHSRGVNEWPGLNLDVPTSISVPSYALYKLRENQI